MLASMDLDDYLALCPPGFYVGQGVCGRVQWEYPIHDWLDRACFDQSADFTQLRSTGLHENEGIVDTVPFRLRPDAVTE